jgi:uncharacterized protein YlaN (UPF0358 family)
MFDEEMDMKKLRAIYIGDVRFEECPVFELNKETDHFEMLKDKDFRYPRECVEEDKDFLIFEVEKDGAKLVSR